MSAFSARNTKIVRPWQVAREKPEPSRGADCAVAVPAAAGTGANSAGLPAPLLASVSREGHNAVSNFRVESILNCAPLGHCARQSLRVDSWADLHRTRAAWVNYVNNMDASNGWDPRGGCWNPPEARDHAP